MVREFFSGVGLLFHGFGLWRRNPRMMLLGLVPALIVFALVVAALVALGFSLPGFIGWLTPFDDDWPEPWPSLIAGAIGTITVACAIVIAAVVFTAVTLAVGDPFYEQLWREVELELSGEVPESGAGFWAAARGGLTLIALGVLTAIGVGLAGALPLVGVVVGPILGVVLSGRLLAMELSSRAFHARDNPAAEQRALRRGIRWQLLGFGVATQLLFMVPLGAVVTMPAAVAGSTYLARRALDLAGGQQPHISGAMSPNTFPSGSSR